MTKDSEIAAYDALMDLGLLEPIKERMQWEIEGEKQTWDAVRKADDVVRAGRKLSGFQKRLLKDYLGEGHIDYNPADAGMEKQMK